MKKSELRQIIKEEISKVLSEGDDGIERERLKLYNEVVEIFKNSNYNITVALKKGWMTTPSQQHPESTYVRPLVEVYIGDGKYRGLDIINYLRERGVEIFSGKLEVVSDELDSTDKELNVRLMNDMIDYTHINK